MGISRSAIRCAALLLVCALPQAGWAELSNDPLLGPGLRSRPAYDGAASQHVELVPVIRYFGEHVFARSTQGVLEGGARVELIPGLHAAAQLAYEPGRISGESDFLEQHHASDIDRGVSAGLQMEWDHMFDPVPITLLARVRRHLDADLGTQADLRLSAGIYRGGPVGAGVFTQATWADAKSAGAYYGITPQQSATMGLPEFEAGAGWLFTSFGLLGSVDLSSNWVVVGSIESRTLRGSAAHSPLADRTSNLYANVGVAWRF